MRLLYLYPEEWTGRRAREVHTLSTCVALAQQGVEVTLVTAGGLHEMHNHLRDMAGKEEVTGLHLVALSRTLGPIRSAAIFKRGFNRWLQTQDKFDLAYIIHLKAADMLMRSQIPYAYEAHEIFAETPQKNSKRQLLLALMERQVVLSASLRIATSTALATGLKKFALSSDFTIVPNAGLPPLNHCVGAPDGPFVYCGSIADWKGLDRMIPASRDAQVPLKIIGGTEDEWKKLGKHLDTNGIVWQPRVLLADLPKVLAGARAGLIPTHPDTPSGRYSCPMKLFDYARCGLPVISTALPSLQSLNVGLWCTQVSLPGRTAWTQALKHFRYEEHKAEAARMWSGEHTWAKRAESLKRAFGV